MDHDKLLYAICLAAAYIGNPTHPVSDCASVADHLMRHVASYK